ncbi:LysM peptidoglycan-binding domain-containing protein, partial [Kineosporia sp. J2-2]
MAAASRIGGLVRAVVALALLCGVVLGCPVVLIRMMGMPWGVAVEVGELIGDGCWGGAVGVRLVVLIGWVWWAGLMLDGAGAVRAVLRTRRGRQALVTGFAIPGLSLRRRSLITGLLLAPLSVPTTALAATQGPVVSLAAVPADRTGQGQAEKADSVAKIRVGEGGASATLWGLAERHLGDGARWHEIWDLNVGRRQEDGTVMRSPDLLRPGWTVLVPGGQIAEPAATQGQGSTPFYRIARGDQLGAVADRFLGDAEAYDEIRQANRKVITDVDHIETGDVISLPDGSKDRGVARHASGRARNTPMTSEGDRPDAAGKSSGSVERGEVPSADSVGPAPSPSPSTNSPGESAGAPGASAGESSAARGRSGSSAMSPEAGVDPAGGQANWGVYGLIAALVGLLGLRVTRRRRPEGGHRDRVAAGGSGSDGPGAQGDDLDVNQMFTDQDVFDEDPEDVRPDAVVENARRTIRGYAEALSNGDAPAVAGPRHRAPNPTAESDASSSPGDEKLFREQTSKNQGRRETAREVARGPMASTRPGPDWLHPEADDEQRRPDDDLNEGAA